jgi:hypothetical protein
VDSSVSIAVFSKLLSLHIELIGENALLLFATLFFELLLSLLAFDLGEVALVPELVEHSVVLSILLPCDVLLK